MSELIRKLKEKKYITKIKVRGDISDELLSKEISQTGSIKIVKDVKKSFCAVIRETNAPLMDIMYKAGLAANEDYMTYEEAANVCADELNNGTGSSTSIFNKYKDTSNPLVSFDEFQYFTGVEEIKGYTFYNCSELTSITLPASITKFGTECFYGCGNNLSIHVDSIEQYMTIEKDDWADEWWNLYIGDKLCTEVMIDTSYVQDYLFECCDSLQKVTLTDNVQTIGIGSFMVCKSITELNMSNSITTIKDYSLYCLRALKSIVLPSTTTSIGDNVLTGCVELSDIYCYATTAPNVILTTFGHSINIFEEYVGINNKPNNILHISQDATGYDTSYWKDPLQNSSKCGFTIEYI